MTAAIDEKKLDEFMDQVKKVEKGHKLDLSSDQDLSIAVMNLISIEEHLFFTAEKTGNESYFDLLAQVREMRKVLLKQLIQDYEGEVWCISKHLLAASMRLMEVGTKAMTTRPKEARQFFEQSYRLYNLFWALNLKMIDRKKVSALDGEAKKAWDELELEHHEVKKSSSTSMEKTIDDQQKQNASMWKKLGQALNKALDCCRE